MTARGEKARDLLRDLAVQGWGLEDLWCQTGYSENRLREVRSGRHVRLTDELYRAICEAHVELNGEVPTGRGVKTVQSRARENGWKRL